MAFFRPDLFRRVLTYSGTYTNQQSPFNAETPHGHWELHSGLELIANSDPKPLKVTAEPDLLPGSCFKPRARVPSCLVGE